MSTAVAMCFWLSFYAVIYISLTCSQKSLTNRAKRYPEQIMHRYTVCNLVYRVHRVAIFQTT